MELTEKKYIEAMDIVNKYPIQSDRIKFLTRQGFSVKVFVAQTAKFGHIIDDEEYSYICISRRKFGRNFVYGIAFDKREALFSERKKKRG